ncbi:MAG: hypothetical protein RJB39_495 [Candidatus Parcubacteria bacterium]|jgi:hypothetical protein
MKTLQILLFFLFALSARATTVFAFGGQGYVSQNLTHTMSQANGFNIDFFGTQDLNNPRAMIDVFARETSSPSNLTILQILSGDGSDLAVGNYPEATWFEPGHPGIIFSTGSRGFNDTDSWFNVLELQWGTDNKPTVLAVDFYLKENIPNTNWVRGSIRFNSNIPVGQVPEPSSALLILVAALGLTRRNR